MAQQMYIDIAPWSVHRPSNLEYHFPLLILLYVKSTPESCGDLCMCVCSFVVMCVCVCVCNRSQHLCTIVYFIHECCGTICMEVEVFLLGL